MTDFLPPSPTSIEELNKVLEKTRLEHSSLVSEISEAKGLLNKSRMAISELSAELSRIGDIIERSKNMVEDTKQLHLTREVQRKQLDDHHEWLKKEHDRIQDWDKAVSSREKAYQLKAETGYLGTTFNGSV